MKTKYNLLSSLAILLFIIPFGPALAQQNFVTNPGFETQNGCPIEGDVSSAPPWNSPSQGTPDLFNSSCSSQNESARTGIGSVGLIAYNANVPNQREYVQVALDTPLVAAQNYCISMWVKHSSGRYAINNLGLHLSVNEVNENTSEILELSPNLENPPSVMLDDTTQWVELSGHIDAKGGESYVLIGNFYTDSETETSVIDSSNSLMIAYYQIDDISIQFCSVGIDDNSLENQLRVFPTLADDKINIRFPKNKYVNSITLTNIAGQQVAQLDEIDNTQGGVVLPTFNYPQGIYMLSVSTDTETVTRKVMLVR